MSAVERISEFVQKRLQELKQEGGQEQELAERLNTSARRISFANIMNVFLGEKGELGGSNLEHAQTHFTAHSHQQAIFYAQLAKKHLKEQGEVEVADLLILRCLLKLERVEEAHEMLQREEEEGLSREKLSIKAEVAERMGDKEETDRLMEQLQAHVELQHSEKSSEMGLFLIERGRQKGVFNKPKQALKLMQAGMNTLIAVKHQDQGRISQVYRQMAELCRELGNLQEEYSALICAYSMLRQCPDSQKQIVDVLHAVIRNQLQQGNLETALKELLKVEALEKRIYGESSGAVGRTLKKIAGVMEQLGRRNDARRYELEHSRIANCNEKKGMSRDKPLRYSQVRLHA